MPIALAIAFFLGVLVGVLLAYHFAGVSAMRQRLKDLERDEPPPP